MAMRSILVGVAVSVVDPSNPHMRLESRDSLLNTVPVPDLQSLSVDPIGRLKTLGWHAPSLVDVSDLEPPPTASERIGTAALHAAQHPAPVAYKANINSDLAEHKRENHSIVGRTPAPLDGNISAPMSSAVNAFMGTKGAPPRVTNATKAAVMPHGAEAEVQQAEEAKEEKAKIEAAKAKEEAMQKAEKLKGNANKTLTPEAKAAAEANKTAPLSSTVTHFLPLSLLSLRPAEPPVGRLELPPKAYERKRNLLWKALSSGMSISPHHDMPVSRSLSLIEFVHTTNSHRTLALIVPTVVVTLVLVALSLEQLPFWGMIKCSRGRMDMRAE